MLMTMILMRIPMMMPFFDDLKRLHVFSYDVDHAFVDSTVWMWTLVPTFRNNCSSFLRGDLCPLTQS